MGLFAKLNRRDRTIVLMTHDAEIPRHARRVLTMQDGRIISDEANGEGAGS